MVQFPALKVHFYHKEILTTLGNLIGRTIRLDFHTLTVQRAKFARIAVEVDLSKPLVPRIWLADAWQKVEYENLPEVCFECDRIEHSSTLCPKLQTAKSPAILAITSGETQATEAAQATEESNPGFGPWMLVSCKSRRNSRDLPKKGKLKTNSRSSSGGIVSKQGKQDDLVKENRQASPISSTPTSFASQRPPSLERKGGAGKKAGDGIKKGKEIVSYETHDRERGLLGSKPDSKASGSGSKPTTDQAQDSTSAHILSKASATPKSKTQPPSPPPISNHASVKETGSSTTLASSPSVSTITSVNGTSMQIVNLQPKLIEEKKGNASQSPSVKTRTKKSKARQSGDRMTPTKLSPMKGLQVWTPKKDRKTKARSRIATLTLQEINVWTGVARETSEKAGGNNTMSRSEEQPGAA
ncbi:unnamed protein product [Linum tenue]|uniref:DUF4283 domain-containing protein n=1 Tax=Linum tenue TaxID=586396 RepID=A0AAV0S368_9ROSI|nr:unnamed protein product [Linum tenue]